MRVPFLLKLIFNRYFFEKLVALVLLGVLLYTLESFLFIFLITFLFAYLFLDLGKIVEHKLSLVIKKTKAGPLKQLLTKINHLRVIVTLLYAGFIILVGTIFYNLVPHLIDETKTLIQEGPQIMGRLQSAADNLQSSVSFDLGLDQVFSSVVNKSAVENTLTKVFENAKNIGLFLFEVAIALILSYVFIIDRERIEGYVGMLKGGNFAFVYDQFSIIAHKISRGFGLIFKAQAIIALVNAVLTTIGLLLISFIHGEGAFPFIATLGITVFIFGFIPVLGFFISSVPILIIGFNYGGVNVIAAILVMIAIIHTVEAYYLNPKIVSSYMEFPVFITFLVLLLSEHFFGFVGLLIGVPLFYIFIDLVKDFDLYVEKIKKISRTIDTAKTTTKEAIHKNIRLSRSGKRSNE